MARFPAAFAYVLKGAGTSATCTENRRALDRWKLVPRVLNDVGERHLEVYSTQSVLQMVLINKSCLQTTIFGVTHPAPIFVAPVGAQGLVHNDGELGTARAAAKVGVPMIVSSVASRSMEEIVEAQGPNGHRWFQLYWQVHLSVNFGVFIVPKADSKPGAGLTLLS